jgi:hypothetical protein
MTTAGIATGIDMALWRVGQIHVLAYAQRVMQYDPTPPYGAEV